MSTWWRLESQATSRELAPSKDDRRALTILEKTTKHVDGRYEVGLLWKENAALPNHYAAAVSHFIKTKERLEKDEKLFELYSKTIPDDIERGFIRKIEHIDIPETGWLIPEHPVTNPNKPGKVRRVSNAAAKYRGVCLNDMLLTGPDLPANLVGAIFRFRETPIPISADIEAMYVQVSVRPEDRKFLRFLWGKDEAQMYEYMRHVFGAKCSPTWANYALQKCGSDQKEIYPAVHRIVHENFFMDDLFLSVDTIDEAKSVINDLRNALRHGGFNLTKWVSTNTYVLNCLPSDGLRAPPGKQISHDHVFGVPWNMNEDTLSSKMTPMNLIRCDMTQRQLLQAISLILDPPGIATPVTIRLRMILQTVWRSGKTWDEPLTAEMFPSLKQIASGLICLQPLVIPRQYFISDKQSVGLHVFCDASYAAICAFAYFVLNQGDTISVVFVFGKARVAPIKQQTITKLELQAALLGSRISKFICREHRITLSRTLFWTDSSTVLQ